MKRIGVGIIGWGFMGKTHTHALREMPLFYPGAGFEPVLASVCSRRVDMAKEAARQMGFAHFTDDYMETLRRDDVQVVSICTPNELHEEMALRAIELGKHVYLDKPVSTDYASAKRIADAAKKAVVTCQVALNNRFLPAIIRAKQLIDEGRIGEVTAFRCYYKHSGSIDPNRPVGWKQLSSAGVLQDLGSHALDMITWLIGAPESLMCSLRTLYPARPKAGGGEVTALGDDHALIVMKMPGGAVGTVEASKIWTGADDELGFDIAGTKGAIRFDLMQPNYVEFFDNAVPEAAYGGERGYVRIAAVARFEKPAGAFLPPKNTIGWDRAHMHCYYSFLQSIADGTKPSPNLDDGAEVQRLMDLCTKSHNEARWLQA